MTIKSNHVFDLWHFLRSLKIPKSNKKGREMISRLLQSQNVFQYQKQMSEIKKNMHFLDVTKKMLETIEKKK